MNQKTNMRSASRPKANRSQKQESLAMASNQNVEKKDMIRKEVFN
jgi:hypothetical protein